MEEFFEQLMRPRIAFDTISKGSKSVDQGPLRPRRVVTMGTPTLIYRWFYGGHGLRGLERGVFRCAGMKPERQTMFGMVEAAGNARRRRWLDRMREYGRRLI